MGTLSNPPPRPRRWLRRLTWALLAVGVVVNGVAFQHARALTNFHRGAGVMPRPERLPLASRLGLLLTGVAVPRPENQRTPSDLDLEYSRELVPGEGGVTLELWHVPAVPARGVILALHGYGDCKSKLLSETEVFHELGYHVVLLDFRGSGGSSESYTTLGCSEADDLDAAWKSLAPGLRAGPVILYGRSMGSVAALRAMALHGIEPAGAILECPFDRMSTAIGRRCDLMGLPRFPATELLLFWGSVQLGMNAFAHNPVEYARSVECPVLLLRGGADSRVHQSDLEAIADSLPHPPRVVVFPECGHESCARHDRDLFRQSVSTFLESIER